MRDITVSYLLNNTRLLNIPICHSSRSAAVAKDAGAKVASVEDFTQAVTTLLKQARVDATVNDSLAILDYQKSIGDNAIKIAATTGECPSRSSPPARAPISSPPSTRPCPTCTKDGI